MKDNFKWVTILFCFLGIGAPMGIVPGEEDPVLMRMAPEEVLMYASWAGTQAADPDGNATEKWIAQKDMQRFWSDMGTKLQRLATAAIENSDDDPALGQLYALSLKLPKLLCRQPCGFYIDQLSKNGKDYGGVLVINLGERKDEIAEQLKKAKASIKESIKLTHEHGTDWLVSDADAWLLPSLKTKIGIHERYLVIGFSGGECELNVSSFFENKDTPEPKWLTKIKQKLPVPRRASVGYVNTPLAVRALEGLEADVKTIGFVNGLDDEGYLGRVWIEGGDESEFAKVINGPIEKKLWEKMPAGNLFTATACISKEEMFKAVKSVSNNDPMFEELIANFEAFGDGVTLKDELMSNIGDNIFVIGEAHSLGLWGTNTNPSGLCLQVKDEMGFLDTIEGFAKRLKEVSEDTENFTIETKVIEEVKVYLVTRKRRSAGWRKIYFALHNSQLVVVNNLKLLKKVLFTEELDEKQRWVKAKRVNRLYQYANDQKLGEPNLLFEVDPKPILQTGHGLSGLLVSYGLAKVPDVGTMTNGLEPCLTGVFKTEDGFQIVQQNVLPSGTPPSFLGFAAVIANALSVQSKLQIIQKK